MSTKAFDQALDFLPEARAQRGPGRGKFILTAVIEALSEARTAEAEYRRQVARGVEPSEAVEKAFAASFGSR